MTPPPIPDDPARARLGAAHVFLDRLLHDLKQPINLIKLSAQDVRIDISKGRFDLDSLPEQLLEIENAVSETARRIDQLRAFGQPGASRSSTPESDINQACGAAVARIQETSAAIEIVQTLTPDLPAVGIDPRNLEQAVWELLDNAARAAQDAAPGPPQVQVRTCRRDQNLVITVQDNGTGVPPGKSSEIFIPFFSTYDAGSGLGLPLAAALVGEAGGQLTLARSADPGALFEISLRL